jgi:MFS family permease
MIFVVPAGIIADDIGRKKVLIISSVIYLIGWVVYGLGHHFIQFFAAEIILGISTAMWIASGGAFFYDTLKELGQEKKFKKLYGNVAAINYVMYGLSSLAGGYMALYGFRPIFFYTAIPIAFATIVTFTLTETKLFKHAERNYFAHLKEAARFAASHQRIRFLIIYGAIIFGVWFSGYMLYQPYLKSISVPLAYFGIVFFSMNIMAALGSKIANKLDMRIGEKNVLVFIAVVFALSYLSMAFSINTIGLIFPIILSLFFGIFEVSIVDYFNKLIESYHRATVGSLSNLVSNLSCSIIAPFFGIITDKWSISTAFKLAFVMIAINLIFSVIILYFVKNNNKKNKNNKKIKI